MGYRRPDGARPPEDSYSRVTEPERFAVVVEAADRLVERLLASYDVVATPAQLDGALRAVRLAPRVGAPLTIGVTGFPGVLVRAGTWTSASSFPDCGCDACDESGPDAVDALLEEVGAVVRGGFREHLSARALESSWRFDQGERSTSRPLGRAERRELTALAPAEDRRWPAWAVGAPSVVPAT